MATDSITLVQLARLGDLAQTTLLISRLHQRGQTVRLVVEENLRSLAELMVGAENVVGIDTKMLRRQANGRDFAAQIRATLGDLANVASDVVINLNFHPAISALAEAIPASKHGGARWRDVVYGTASDSIFAELFRHASGKGRLSSRHLSEIWGGYSELDPKADYYPPSLLYPITVKNTVTEILRNVGLDDNNQPIAIIVGAGLGVRACKPAYWTDVIDRLGADNPIILVGSSAESPRAEKILAGTQRPFSNIANLCGKTDPAELAGLLSQCRLVCGTDTGPLHVAAMTGAKCLGLYFGSMYYRQTGPYGANNYVIAPKIEHYPCSEEEMARHPGNFTAPPADFVAEVILAILSGEDRHSSLSDGKWQALKSSTGKKGLTWNSTSGRADSRQRVTQEGERTWKTTSSAII